jgi:biopolymer transport protein ExbD
MANFQTKGKSPHVDMTPMVDLGFLLITFFMLATSFSKPKVIDTIVPADPHGEVDDVKLNCNRALTLYVDSTDFAKYYICPSAENLANPSVALDSVNYSKDGLRQLILRRQKEANAYFNGEKPLIVLLKATEKARYKHLIDAIDELNITHAQFALVKMDALDSTFLNLKK